MDIKDNKYKRMIDEIPIKEELVSLIGSQVLQYKEKEARIQEEKKKRLRIINRTILIISILVIVASVLTVVISNKGFGSPGKVVIRYISAMEYPQIKNPEQFVVTGYDIYQDSDDIRKTKNPNVSKGIINPENKNISTVVVKVRTLKAVDVETNWFAMGEYEILYKLVKIDGRWYIAEREKGPFKFLNQD